MSINESLTGNYMIARLVNPTDFLQDSFQTTWLSGEETGISLISGILKSDPEGGRVKQAYKFNMYDGWTTSKVKIWLNEQKIKFTKDDEDVCEFVDMKDIEIFATGKWNGKSFGKKDLDDIVDSFKSIGKKLQPYLKLGHDDKQKLLQKDGLPAAGWVTEVKRKGNKLVASFKDVPKIIAKLIKKKAYKRISSELYINYFSPKEENGKKGSSFPLALKAVALLGGDTPAVTSLADVVALYARNNELESESYEFSQEELMEGDEKVMDEKKVDEKEIQTALDTQKKALEEEQLKQREALQADFDKKLADMKTDIDTKEAKYNDIVNTFDKVDDLKKFIDDIKEKEEVVAEKEKECEAVIENAKKLEVVAYVDAMVTENRVMPSQKDMLEKILLASNSQTEELEFSRDNLFGLKEKMSLNDTIRAFVKLIPDLGILKSFASTDGVAQDEDQERTQLVEKYMEEHSVKLDVAQNEIAKVRPDLFTLPGEKKDSE